MTLDSAHVTTGSIQMAAYGFYFALTRNARVAPAGEEPGLGGTLLYTCKLDAESRALIIAANIAGCATLAASADTSAQKQAIRDGVLDFLVTSLDEALRILKNEIRMHKTVAVCVGRSHESVEQEMLERGVEPDFVFAGVSGQERHATRFANASRELQFTKPGSGMAFLNWKVAEAPARWMPKLDAIALDCLETDTWARRWIRLCPRYCGRNALAQRGLYCDPEAANQIIQRIADSVRKGEIGAEVTATLQVADERTGFRMVRSEDKQKES